MSHFIKKTILVSLSLSIAGFAYAAPAAGEGKLSFFNEYSLQPKVVSDAQCAQGPTTANYKLDDKKVTMGNVTLSAKRDNKKKHLKKNLYFISGHRHETVYGKGHKVLYKGKLYYAGVGVKGSHYLYGSFSDGYCAGNYVEAHGKKQ